MIDHEMIVFNKSNDKKKDYEKPAHVLFVGGMGSGKTNSIMNYMMFLQKHVPFQRALYVAGNGGMDRTLEALSPDVKVTSDIQDVQDFLMEIKNTPLKEIEKTPSIIVFDDMQGSRSMRIKNDQLINDMVINHRHYNLWTVFSLQSYKNSLNSNLRKLAELLFLWYSPNEGERKSIIDEVGVNSKKLESAFEQVKGDQYTPLYINLQVKGRPRLFKGFKEEITTF